MIPERVPEVLNMPKMEIERKFLIKFFPSEIFDNLDQFKFADIYQGYTKQGIRIRESVKDKKTTFTQASKTRIIDTFAQHEDEHEIDNGTFNKLWPKTRGRRITKRRYYIPYGDRIIELDIFSGKLKGAILVEVEFASQNQAKSFVSPSWFGRDITLEISNKQLAEGKPFPKS